MCVAGFARRGGAVVAAGAVTGDAGVTHLGAGKRGRALVASLAGRGSDDVCRRLSRRGGAVMAACAIANCQTVVVPYVPPSRRDVTTLASVRSTRVMAWLTRCRTAIVASDARVWRPLKAPINVTRGAFDVGMAARQ